VFDERLALIIVSGRSGYSQPELEKASLFRAYLSDQDHEDEQVRYLTSPNEPGSDGEPTTENVASAFEWLRNRSGGHTEVTIYISDHAQIIEGGPMFQFNDGNISMDTIDGWLDQVEHCGMRIVINGPMSGLGGLGLSGHSRAIYCSMRSSQNCVPDLFNITRGLNDPAADMDEDGAVSFDEAFDMEKELLKGSGQDPVMFK
jgi:hypothetical protein